MGATVILLHRTPDGLEHLDWLLERPGRGPLITFRTSIRPDRPPPWTLAAERLPDHREAYLTYEGPLGGGGRGAVERVAAGWCEVTLDSPDALRAVIRFGGASGELTGHHRGNSLWELDFRAPPFPSGG